MLGERQTVPFRVLECKLTRSIGSLLVCRFLCLVVVTIYFPFVEVVGSDPLGTSYRGLTTEPMFEIVRKGNDGGGTRRSYRVEDRCWLPPSQTLDHALQGDRQPFLCTWWVHFL